MKALGKAIKKSVKDRETSWGKSLVVLGWLVVLGFAASVVLPLAAAVLIPWYLTKFFPVKDTQQKAAVVGLALIVVVAAGWFLGGEIFIAYPNFAGQLRASAFHFFREWPGVFDWRGLVLPGLAASVAFAVGAVHHKNDKPQKRKQVGGAQLATKPADLPELSAPTRQPVKNRPLIGFPIWKWEPGHESVLESVLKRPTGPERERAEARAEKLLSRRAVLLAPDEDNGLIIGPTGSGKTTGIIVPLVASPAYTTANMLISSVKGDVFDDTVALRRRSGTVMVYDPFGVVPGADPYRVKWSPLLSCDTWKGSMRVANSLISHAGLGSRNDGAYFENQAKTTLAPLLYAAHLTGESLTTIMAWLGKFQQNPLDPTIPDILRKAQEQGIRDAEQALNAWMMTAGNSSTTTGSQPFQTISSALACFRSQEVLDGAELDGAVFDPREFVRNQGTTLYLVIPDSDQDLLRPVLTALVTEIFQAGVDYATACGGHLPEKLVAVLDEMAVGTPLPQLPELLATSRSRNITLWHAWQDAAQIRSVYGEKAQTVLNNSLLRMFLPGSADRSTLELVTFLGGQAEMEKRTVSERDGESSESRTTASEALMPADVVRQLPRGTGLLFYGNRKPTMVDLPMSFLVGPLRSQPALDVPVPRQQTPTYVPKPPVVTLTEPESFGEAYAGVAARIDTALGRTVEKDPSEMMIFDWLDDGGS